MEIIHFEEPVRFQERVQSRLGRYEAENNLVLGILANVIAGEYQDTNLYLALVQEEGEMVLAALCTPPYPVLISYQNPAPHQALLQALLDDLESQLGDDFNGLSGNKELITPLIELWQRNSGKEACLEMAQRIYKLERVLPVSGVPGSIRPADEDDRPLLLDWFTGFYRDALAEEANPKRIRKQVNIYLGADPGQRGLMIWEVGGSPVSMAGYSGPTPSGIRVGAVYSPPGQRRKGYASACTGELSQRLLDRGYKFCFLFTDLLNPTSNHIYQQIGYEPVCDVDRYLF